MECPGLDQPGQTKKERPKRNDNKMRRKESQRPRQERPGRNKQQGLPPPGLDHPGTSGGQMPRTRSCGADQAVGAAAKGRSLRRCRDEVTRTRPWTCSEMQTRPWTAQDWIIRGKTRRSGLYETTTNCGGRSPDAPDLMIRGGTSSRGCRPLDWIIRGPGTARRPGLDHPGWIRQQEAPHPGLDCQGTRGGQTSRTGSSGAEQEGTATTSGAREIWPAAGTTRRGPHFPGRSARGKVAASREGNRRPRPRWCREGVKPEATQGKTPRTCRVAEKGTRPRRRRAAKMRTGPW